MLKKSPCNHFFNICRTDKIKRSISFTFERNSGGNLEGRETIGEKKVKESVDSGKLDVWLFVEGTDDNGGVGEGFGAESGRERGRGRVRKGKEVFFFFF